MSRTGEISLDWGGEAERTFRLGIGQIRALQEKLGAGPLGIAAMCQVSFAALAYQNAKDWIGLSRLDLKQVAEKSHVRETLKQALLGAGVALPEADRLIREYVDERPLDENLLVTIAVCNAHIWGVEEESAAGERGAAAEVSQTSTAADIGSEKMASTPSGPPADLRPGMSTP